MTAEAGNLFLEKCKDSTKKSSKSDVLFENVINSSNNICNFLNRHHEKSLQGRNILTTTNNNTIIRKPSFSDNITNYWTTFLSLVSHIRTKTLRRHIIQNNISREIQKSLYPKEAAGCFLKSFSALEWSEMREELMALLNGVRTSTEILSILTSMNSVEHTYAFKDKLEQMSAGFSCSSTRCHSCRRPLTDICAPCGNNDDDNDDIVVFACGHAYHSSCAPAECGCRY